MSEPQKPWDSTKLFAEYTDIERVFLWAWQLADDIAETDVVERAWAALCDKCKEGKP